MSSSLCTECTIWKETDWLTVTTHLHFTCLYQSFRKCNLQVISLNLDASFWISDPLVSKKCSAFWAKLFRFFKQIYVQSCLLIVVSESRTLLKPWIVHWKPIALSFIIMSVQLCLQPLCFTFLTCDAFWASLSWNLQCLLLFSGIYRNSKAETKK